MKIQVNGLDVWGNEDDGFEVNDVLGSHGVFHVRSTENDSIILALIENDIVHAGQYEIDDFGSDDSGYFANLVDAVSGRPLLQLKSVSK